MPKRVVIVGGGISGLSAAYALSRLRPDLELRLFEASARLGGNIGTDRVEGFVIEHGPDSFVVSKPHAVELCRELALERSFISTPPEHRLVHFVRGGKLVPLPEGLVLGVPTRLWPLLRTSLLTLGGKLRAALEPFVAVRRDTSDESVHDFFARRLGTEIAERIAGPLIGGIYAGDPRELSVVATFPQFREMELRHGSLVLGMLAARGHAAPKGVFARWLALLSLLLPRKPNDPPAFVSLREGMQSLVDALTRALPPDAVVTSSAVASVAVAPDQARVTLSSGQTIEADAVLLATPPQHTAALLSDDLLESELSAIGNVDTATVVLAFAADAVPHPLRGVGFVVPKGEGQILAATWISSKWPHRAPSGKVLLRVFLGGPGAREQVALPDATLIALALSELRRLLGPLGEPLFSRVYRYRGASPQPSLGHPERMQRVHARAQEAGRLFLSAGGLDGIGIPDSIKHARLAAERIAATLVR